MAGALLNPATAVAGPESSFGQNLQNPKSSASGLYGFTDATWQANLKAIGGDPAQYPTARSAPNSLQTAVFAADYNRQGFSDWLCSGCDATFTQEFNNAGGSSAYAPQGSLSTTPADYASMDAPGGLQAYFNSNSGGSFIGSASIGSNGSAADAAPNQSATSKPFSYTYSLLVTGATQGISANIQNVQNLVHPWLSAAMAISIMLVAIATMLGRISINNLFSHAIRVSLVAAFVAPGSSFYTNYVINPIYGLPQYLARVAGIPNAGPMAVFDDSYITLWTMTETVLKNTHISWNGDGVGTILAAIVIYGVGVICLAILTAPFIAVNYLLLLMLVFGPIIIVAALFRVLDRWLMGYVDVIASLAVSMLAINVVITFYQIVIIQIFNGFIPSASGDKDIPAFGGLVLVLVAMAYTVIKYLIPTIVRIFGGVGLPLEAGAAFLASQATRAARFAVR